MALSRRRLKNDVDRRLTQVVAQVPVMAFLTEKDVQSLTRSNLDYWIAELRKGETSVRQLRRRLEALRDEVERPCQGPECSRPVTGRPDAVYCGASCRIRAHRQQRKAGNG
ncbi:hypothetical protein ABGB07_03805 [Micromonosporaceae bacterium B7E4]